MKYIIVYSQKSSEQATLQNSMTLVYTESPANFERRLRTSLKGTDASSLAHAKYEWGRLKITNIAIVNTDKWNSKSQNLTLVVFQRQFLLQKKQDFVQKKKKIYDNLKR